MMYETNTLHRCYESVGANADKARRTQKIWRHPCSQLYPPLFQTNSIFILDICKLIKTANKDRRNMSLPSGPGTIERCCGDGTSSPVALCLSLSALVTFLCPSRCRCASVSPHTTFSCPHNRGIDACDCNC